MTAQDWYKNLFNTLETIANNIGNALKYRLITIIDEGVDNGNYRGSIAEGTNLAKTVEKEVNSVKDGFEINIMVKAPYAKYVNDGTGPAVGNAPYFPNVTNIKKWVLRYGLVNLYNSKKNTTEGFTNDPNHIAWAISKSIYRTGTVGWNFIETLIAQSGEIIDSEIKKANIIKGVKLEV